MAEENENEGGVEEVEEEEISRRTCAWLGRDLRRHDVAPAHVLYPPVVFRNHGYT